MLVSLIISAGASTTAPRRAGRSRTAVWEPDQGLLRAT